MFELVEKPPSIELPPDCVRGRIKGYLERNADLLGRRILEVGSLLPSESATWANNRSICEHDLWVGTDMQAGYNVDRVINGEALDYQAEFSGVVCSEVLEHVRRPWDLAARLHDALIPGGWCLVTTLTAFPIHGYPDDYWRYTPSGLAALLVGAGFTHVTVETAGVVEFALNDHGEEGLTRLTCPMHVFARGRK